MNYKAFQALVTSPEREQIRAHILTEYPGTPPVQVELRDFDTVMEAIRAVVPENRIGLVDPTRRPWLGTPGVAGLALVGVGGVSSDEISQMLAALKLHLVKADFDPTSTFDQQLISLMIGTIWNLIQSPCRGDPPPWEEINALGQTK